MTEAIGLTISVLIAVFTWRIVPAIFDRAGLTNVPAPNDESKEIWNTLCESGYPKAGTWLGTLERFVGVAAMWTRSPELLIGWFAFKVASKWQIWTSVVQVPESIEGLTQVSYLKLRRQWGANLLLRFLIGTVTNILLGMFAGVVGLLIVQQIDKLNLY